jgi:hypothetical protein
VPCRTHGPCNSRYSYADLLARLTSGRCTAYCSEIDDSVDIIELLQGIPGRDSELRNAVRDVLHSEFDIMRSEMMRIGDSQRQMMKEITKVRTAMHEHCPSEFAVTRAGKRRPGQKFFMLRQCCEEPGSWHPLPGDAGCYETAEQSEWLRRAGPWIACTLELLKAAIPLTGPVLSIDAHELSQRISDDIALTQALLDEGPRSGCRLHRNDWRHRRGRTGNTRTSIASRNGRRLPNAAPRTHQAGRGPMVRWTELLRHPGGVGLYLCTEHFAAYQRLPAEPTG